MVEAAFRLAGPNVPLDLTMARFQAYHPVYGFFHQPGVSGWVRTDEFTSFVKFNTQGLRGPEVAIPKPAGTFRALVLGDSVVEGAQVAEDATMAGRLRTELAGLAGGRRVETVNAGVAGFGTGQQLLFLEREGLAYQPDLIVLVFTIANDPADNSLAVAQRYKLAAERRPFFLLRGGELELQPFQAPPPEQWSGVRTFLRDHSVVFTALELWWIGKTVARAQGDVVPPLRRRARGLPDRAWRRLAAGLGGHRGAAGAGPGDRRRGRRAVAGGALAVRVAGVRRPLAGACRSAATRPGGGTARTPRTTA